MLRIDADAHVLETEETWEFMDGADRKFRPEVVGSTNGSGSGDEYWLVDGTLRLKTRNVGKDTPLESRELRDVAVRLKHMDELKVDIQVIFPTIFIIPLTPRPEIELALCRSYNRWMGECWKQSDNRLRWVAMVPLLNTDKVYEEARLAKENGAVGIYMRGSEGERLLSDAHFHPVYDAAQRLDIPVCIHSSNGSSVLYDYYKYETVGFSKFKLVVVGAFHTIIMDKIPERFPKLKMAFLEVGSQWLPYALSDLYKRYTMTGKEFSKKDVLAQNRIWIGCETNDDLPYVIDTAGDDHLVVGTDYGHADSATELLALDGVASDPRLSPEAVAKITGGNARALYSL
ncbi:MAG: amidohydrolase family protein [Deltaproteobacteria bacterium]|nr:amidohydrolase family protein [Deltaproteobacteria bacterium]